jgi:hypothetical protein
MADVSVPYSQAGQAAFELLDTWSQSHLINGEHPKLSDARPYPVAASEVLAQFSVVGLDGDGKLVLAQQDGDPQAIGVLAYGVTGNDDGDNPGLVFFSGHFNMDALVWHAGYDTDAKKAAAFEDAPTPVTIRISKRG